MARRLRLLAVLLAALLLAPAAAAAPPAPHPWCDASLRPLADARAAAADPASGFPDQAASVWGPLMMAQRAVDVGEHVRGRQYAEAAVTACERALPPDHPELARALLLLGHLLTQGLRPSEAEAPLRRALALREQACGPDHPATAASLAALGAQRLRVGATAAAGALLWRAHAIANRTAPDSLLMAQVLRALAQQLEDAGADPRAQTLLEQADALLQRHDAISVARADLLRQRSRLHADRGDAAVALELLTQAVAVFEMATDVGDPRRADALAELATLQLKAGQLDLAERLLGLAHWVHEAILGARHPAVAADLAALARLQHQRGEPARAEIYDWRALAIREAAHGPRHPAVAESLSALATSYLGRGDRATARRLWQRALDVFVGALGPDHPSAAETRRRLADLDALEGQLDRAIEQTRLAEDSREKSLGLILSVGSERQRRLYLRTLDEETDRTLTLHLRLAPDDPAAARLALRTVLRRKGRVLDAMSDSLAALRARLAPTQRALLDGLAALRSELATRALAGPGDDSAEAFTQALAALQQRVQQAEAALSQTARPPAPPPAATVSAVQAALPKDAALVELVAWTPRPPGLAPPSEPRRYAACVLRPDGRLQWTDLGPAEPIDYAIKMARKALSDPERDDALRRGRTLYDLVLAPLAPALEGARHLLISPDGPLNLVPFAAFVLPDERYLIEAYTVSYLSSARDLLRASAAAKARAAPAIVAAPDFSAASPAPPAASGDAPPAARRSAKLRGMTFDPLPGTSDEATALKALLGKPTLLLDKRATESALKALRGPRLLHVATHGFFLDHTAEADGAGALENPLLRSGLALAGANVRSGARDTAGADDGILTALEASSLDLAGTRVVVLSACETGVGEITAGDGVHGLRRALVLAGSQSQVMSLWEVDDLATRDLMIALYGKLEAGTSRAEAIREAQLALLRDPMRSHPFYWAAFILSGDWGRLPR